VIRLVAAALLMTQQQTLGRRRPTWPSGGGGGGLMGGFGWAVRIPYVWVHTNMCVYVCVFVEQLLNICSVIFSFSLQPFEMY